MYKKGEYHLGPQLTYCGQLSKQRMDRSMQKYGITQAQAHVILYLLYTKPEDEVNQKDLEKQFRIKASTVNGLVERLEEKGMLIRAPGKRDGRCRRLIVTDKGRQLEQEMRQSIEETEALMVQGFTQEEQVQFRALLGRMIANLKGGTIDL